ncbi:RNA polymerase sigma factor [Chondrinema litorale]|uniref:RNA polymerase sigma factor n=1 Tax=Chondrinema litorale TaxID=2994555 RepID=UPI002543797E|nr:sigma-70 family RNA polymerase sigma factor [Chondrinema litorale]UZR98074.1 sigma-70 family RNA polymerase sigma factor [Chondrinema litorale]
MKTLKVEKLNTLSEKGKIVSTYKSMKDSDVWQLFLDGNGEAFNHIYYNYFPILFNYGHQFCQDRALVKDAVQELFIYLKEKRKKLGQTNNIKFYLYKCLRRNILKALSKNKNIVYVDNLPSTADFEISISHETFMIRNQSQIEIKRRLEQGIEKLTKRQKEAIIYYYYEGFNYEQIAELMMFSKAEYARKLVYRSLDTLKKYVPETLILTWLGSVSVLQKGIF